MRKKPSGLLFPNRLDFLSEIIHVHTDNHENISRVLIGQKQTVVCLRLLYNEHNLCTKKSFYTEGKSNLLKYHFKRSHSLYRRPVVCGQAKHCSHVSVRKVE